MTVYLIPTTRDQLIQNVADGLGDIAAGNLTVTPARQLLVEFVVQGHTVREVVVTGAEAAPVASLADLGGRTVDARPSRATTRASRRSTSATARRGCPKSRCASSPTPSRTRT